MSNIDHPAHYTNREHECIDEMIAMFGERDVIAFCKCNAWKYRYRADSKGKHDEDMQKADWYISKAMELQAMLKEKKEQTGMCSISLKPDKPNNKVSQSDFEKFNELLEEGK